MRKLHTLTLVLAACLLPVLFACEREEPSIALDNTSLVLPENGGSVTLNVTTNYDWTATSSDPWLQVSPTSGKKGPFTLTIKADTNDKASQRKASFTISCRDLSRSISVTQLPKMDQQMQITHSNDAMTAPLLIGSSLAGKVNWGDGVEEAYKAHMTHEYTTTGDHTMVVVSAGAVTFTIESLVGVKSVDLQQF
ncbi:MAG: BACON domain-containing protein [Bacteroidales bacterium]|jgi:hypothetical protein|nr:BACON domain-containing protein [Bacteroidales bacterium]MBQ1636650.1 BACON domain-containing protein [Bacteroidales bacterium]MBQ1754221.1 BACON domain-containing protein [Bacteroidales bacterium]MBQ2149394.1 BACON domain-containing protein [Bacteroidales bacterium]MBQ2194302.1 BACON domain-containing protein [Bacteroidales bacterium]